MDIGPGDRISWITDLGWMMGPWLIYGALILGGTIVLYDGAADFPAPDRLWSFSARHSVNVLGVSPSLIRKLAEYGDPQTTRSRSFRTFVLSRLQVSHGTLPHGGGYSRKQGEAVSRS